MTAAGQNLHRFVAILGERPCGQNDHPADARAIRTEVFIQEQKVPEEMEWDDDDLTAVHFVLYDKGTPAGCARLLPDGHFGRMAVRREWRRSGAGSVLLQSLMARASSLACCQSVIRTSTFISFGIDKIPRPEVTE